MNKIMGFFRYLQWGMMLMLAIALAGCGDGSGRDPILGSGGGGFLAPTVTSVTPLNTTVGVPINTTVTANFSEPMQPLGSGASFSLSCQAPCSAPTGNVTLDATGSIATFTLVGASQLLPSTVYTATVTGVRSRANGLPIAAPYVWSFTTAQVPDTTRPRVTQTAPGAGVSGVVTNSAIATIFTKEMAPSTINVTTYTLTCAAPCVAPAGTVSYAVGSRTAIFTPTTLLAAGTTYTATVTTGATDLAGNALAGNQAALPAASNFVWTFTTAAAVNNIPPRVTTTAPMTTVPGPTLAVPTNAPIAAIFTEAMAPATITNASFTVTCAAPCVSPAGNVSYVAATNTAVFTPTALLAASTTYTATVTTAATDLAGNALVGNQASPPAPSNYSWTFTTAAVVPVVRPQVTLTVPVTSTPGPTTGVPSNSSVSALFTKDMDPTTITGLNFTVTCASPCVSPAGAVSYVAATRTALFTPVGLLAAGTMYTVTLSTAVTDTSGNALAGNTAPLPGASNYVWTFTTAVPSANMTVSSTQPLNLANAVCPSAAVNASFNVPSGLRMDPNTVNSSTFTVTGPGPAFTPVVAAGVVLDAGTGLIATFTPAAPLTVGTTYTARIVGGVNGVKDLAIPANDMVTDYRWTFTPGPATGKCLAPIPLNNVSTYGAFGGSAGATSQGLLTVINGNLGTTAVSTAVTGFHDSTVGCTYTETPLNTGAVNGTIYTAAPPPTVNCPTEGTAVTFAAASSARASALTAYNALVAAPGGPDPGAGNLANLVLTPGVYTAASGSFEIVGGDLTLDAQGDANATWIFQMATSLTVGGPGAAFPQSVKLVNGAQAKNVFWQVGSAAIINAAGGGTMTGTIIAQSGVAISTPGNVTPVILNGRAISLGASVTMVNTVINVPAP